MKRFILLTATALLSTTTIASAHEYGYGGGTREIDARQSRQEQRIQQGVRTGELTRGEFYRLEAEQDRIRRIERQAKSDGYVSASERARIRHAQDEASRHIYQEKHDGQRRWW